MQDITKISSIDLFTPVAVITAQSRNEQQFVNYEYYILTVTTSITENWKCAILTFSINVGDGYHVISVQSHISDEAPCSVFHRMHESMWVSQKPG